MSAPTIAREHRRMATSVHEAGHVAANFVQGLAFVKVRVITDDSGIVEGVEIPEGWELPRAISSAAGYAAEVRWVALAVNVPDRDKAEMIDFAYTASEFDLGNVRHYARAAGVSVSVVRSRAATLVAQNWAPIMRTARYLYSARTANEAKIRRVARLPR